MIVLRVLRTPTSLAVGLLKTVSDGKSNLNSVFLRDLVIDTK